MINSEIDNIEVSSYYRQKCLTNNKYCFFKENKSNKKSFHLYTVLPDSNFHEIIENN